MSNQILLPALSAVVLGFRHGIDWDHVAAITDIVGTTNPTGVRAYRRSLTASLMYALGHAGVVAILGVCALCFSAVLPTWLDPIMERIVGCTLLALGMWLCVSLVRHFRGKEQFRMQSRWMAIFELFHRFTDWLSMKLTGRKTDRSHRSNGYGTGTVFGIGMIHGIGAETGTQVLIIAAIGGTANHGLGLVMLAAFLCGLLMSNTLVAALGTAGFSSTHKMNPLYIASGALTCSFSLAVGTFLVMNGGLP